MRLELHPSSRGARVLPVHILDYAAFRQSFSSGGDESELHLLEKFHAARSLIQSGLVDTFVDVTLQDTPRRQHALHADVCSDDDGELTAVFCETSPPSEELFHNLELIEEADNLRAILLYPFRIGTDEIEQRFPEALRSGKISIEQVYWRERALDRTFREALEMMDLLCNETRVRMLLPLLEKPYGKKHYRAEINPKLVYENVSSLLTHRLIDELEDDTYGLTSMGKRILGEYLAFVERVRRVLEEEDRE